ncbi:glycosyltransferase [Synechocystis sp. LKSZ1]|uniref:glycosyltransferase n=1 Tax=Synechocystis sp. LKSZ1 TaxID=3144951 RepID=UPI00336BF238
MALVLGIALLSLLIWLFLLLFWGQFWRCNQTLGDDAPPLSAYPRVWAIIPARNEAPVISQSLTSLLNQDYPGPFHLVLVDDQSDDGTGTMATQTASSLGKAKTLTVLTGQPLPPGWSGKLWALEQGIQSALQSSDPPDYFLLTDADIDHSPHSLRDLVQKAETEKLALTSLMVQLRCQSFWEKLLIPAFIFFFQKLYPFPWVNNPQRSTAAAAGGCILIRRQALETIGGIQSLRDALIDDCTLGQKVKAQGQPIWLGLTTATHSLRPYDSLASIWSMVARTAYTQLHYNPFLLGGTILGMGLVYLIPPLALGMGMGTSYQLLAILGGLTWGLMALAYFPTLRLYHLPFYWGLTLPFTALLYTLMTLDSARRHWQGQGGAWKGRVYP